MHLLLGAILLLGMAGFVFHWRMKSALTKEFDNSLKITAQSLQVFIEEEDHRLSMDSDVDDMRQFDRKRGPSVFLLTVPNGREIRRSKSLAGQPLPQKGGTWDKPEFFETTLLDGRKLRCMGIFLDVEPGDEDRETNPKYHRVLLIVGRVNESLASTMSEARGSLLITGIVTLAVLGGLLLVGVHQGLRPLDRLVGQLEEIDGKALATRLPFDSLPTELQPIALTLNGLLKRLEGAFEREKRFTANVAHELRTPLAELRVLAEMSVLVPVSTSEEKVGRWKDVIEASTRMETLALRLLEIARAEHSYEVIHLETIDILPHLESAWGRASDGASGSRMLTLKMDVAQDTRVHADRVLLDIILANLMANAAEHAIPHSVFKVEAEGRTLRFKNKVSDLEEDDLAHLFERFWKKDRSRTDGKRHGLGLALALEAAELMGGSLKARLNNNELLEFTLELPAAVVQYSELAHGFIMFPETQ